MSLSSAQNQSSQVLRAKLVSTPQTFEEAIVALKTFALQAFDREIIEQKLCYHTREHVEGVQRRANQIFQVVHPYLWQATERDRMEALLDLCATAHDMVQIFVPQPAPHTTRRREAGVSETATVAQLFAWMERFNQQCQKHYSEKMVLFTDQDFRLIQTAIEATICEYDPIEQAIFQPALTGREPPVSPIARILALADIGTLGMEGIDAFNREGCLLFLEENPDVRSLLEQHRLEHLDADDPKLCENIRLRLLRRTRFQVHLAQSRLQRFPQELEGFPIETIALLQQNVFPYLTPETIQAIELTTPTAEDTALESLLVFFHFEQAFP
ncbi:MAG: hypothetical protein ACAF41_31125 [Leptolyngbya sp. BL-A-14]